MTSRPDFEVLVVDDNSPDHTGQVADRLRRSAAAGRPGGRADIAVGSHWARSGGTRHRRLQVFQPPRARATGPGSGQSNGYAFQVELNYGCHARGFRLAQVPIDSVDRRGWAKSKMGGHIMPRRWRSCGTCDSRFSVRSTFPLSYEDWELPASSTLEPLMWTLFELWTRGSGVMPSIHEEVDRQ